MFFVHVHNFGEIVLIFFYSSVFLFAVATTHYVLVLKGQRSSWEKFTTVPYVIVRQNIKRSYLSIGFNLLIRTIQCLIVS